MGKCFCNKTRNRSELVPAKTADFDSVFIDNEIPKAAKIIDIGGGDSYLIDNLLEMGYSNLFLLDISENAI